MSAILRARCGAADSTAASVSNLLPRQFVPLWPTGLLTDNKLLSQAQPLGSLGESFLFLKREEARGLSCQKNGTKPTRPGPGTARRWRLASPIQPKPSYLRSNSWISRAGAFRSSLILKEFSVLAGRPTAAT